MRNPCRSWLAGLLAVTLLASAHATTQPRTFDLLTADIADIQAAVGSGTLSYERLVRLYLNRIEAYDKQGPRLNAVISVNPRAIERARALDEERRATGRRSPLHGIPLAVKDNIDTVDLPTTGGNPLFAATLPSRNATVVERLERAGAIVLIKTNLDELAMSSEGLSTVGGQTLNPYDLKRSPGGSSGGTAVAISAGFAAAGLGTETGVSIRGPAANTAIVGVAPSRGLVSRAGVIPISFTQDRVGVHARSVADAARVLEQMRGFDAEDLATADSLGRVGSLPYAVDESALAGSRIGVLRDLFRAGEESGTGNALVERQLALLGAHGATIVDSLSTGRDLVAMMPTLRLNSFELRSAFDAYLHRRGSTAPVKSLADLIATGKYLKGGNMEVRFAETMKVAVLEFDNEYRTRLDARAAVRGALIGLMDARGLDALAYPMKSLGAPLIGSTDSGPRDNAISSVTGLPAIVLHAGMDADGLPLALEILGPPFSEQTLIRIAHAYERARGARPLPKTTPRLTGEVFLY